MRAGVNECVAEPLQAAEIEAAVDAAASPHKQPAATGQVFAFIGAKGGVGTTTVAVNVADRRWPRRAAVARCSSTCTWRTATPRSSSASSRASRSSTRSTTSTASTTRSSRASSCSRRPARICWPRPTSALAQTSSVQRVRSLVEFAASLYRYVVLDVPRSDAAALDALDQAVADRRRRQPGAGDGAQREPDRGGAAPALRQRARHGDRQPRRHARRDRPRRRREGGRHARRALGAERLPDGAAARSTRAGRWPSTTTTSSRPASASSRTISPASRRRDRPRRNRAGCSAC